MGSGSPLLHAPLLGAAAGTGTSSRSPRLHGPLLGAAMPVTSAAARPVLGRRRKGHGYRDELAPPCAAGSVQPWGETKC